MNTFSKSLSLVALAVSLNATGESFNARHVAQGFTSITQDFTASLSNPALINRYDQDDDVYFSLNLGAIISDEYDVFDTGERVADNIDKLSDDIAELNSGDIPPSEIPGRQQDLQEQVDVITADLADIDKKPLALREGVNFFAIIPNQYLSFGLFANQYGRLGITVDYDETDALKLEEAIDTLNEDLLDDLSSSGLGLGYSVVEVGFMFGKEIIRNDNFNISIGAKIKQQRIDLVYTMVNIDSFDEDEFDFDDDFADTDAVNFDLGLYANWGAQQQWHFAFVADNLSEQEINFVRPQNANQQINFSLEPSVKVGLSYQQDWYSISTEIDLTDRESFESLESPKYAAIGAEIKWAEHAQFRLGARTDLNDVESDVYTAGFGLSPWDVFSFDIAALTGDRDTLGLAIQLGLKI